MRLISYMEWYFRPSTSKYLFEYFSVDDSLLIQTRNWPIVQELMVADDVVTPTSWQCQQFPPPWRDKMHVIFDGIDIRLFYSAVVEAPLLLNTADTCADVLLQPDVPVLSFATRGMEPLRGFPEFMRAAAVAQQANRDLQVVIAGRDHTAYSYLPPHSSGSWKQQMLEELSGQLDMNRLHFVGLLNYRNLIQLYRRSDLHCYFTRPYVVSWSVFEAAACGSRLLVNDFCGLNEVFAKSPLISPVNLEDQKAVNHAVLEGLNLPRSKESELMGNLSPGKDLESAYRAWHKLLRP